MLLIRLSGVQHSMKNKVGKLTNSGGGGGVLFKGGIYHKMHIMVLYPLWDQMCLN